MARTNVQPDISASIFIPGFSIFLASVSVLLNSRFWVSRQRSFRILGSRSDYGKVINIALTPVLAFVLLGVLSN